MPSLKPKIAKKHQLPRWSRINKSSVSGRRELEALALAPAEAHVVPIGDMVRKDADSAGAGIGAGVNLGDATDGDACIRRWLLGEGTNLLQHPLRSADPLAHKDVIGALFLDHLLLVRLLLPHPRRLRSC